jgi:hypothetical protein
MGAVMELVTAEEDVPLFRMDIAYEICLTGLNADGGTKHSFIIDPYMETPKMLTSIVCTWVNQMLNDVTAKLSRGSGSDTAGNSVARMFLAAKEVCSDPNFMIPHPATLQNLKLGNVMDVVDKNCNVLISVRVVNFIREAPKHTSTLH